MKFSVSLFFFIVFLFIYLFIYLFRAANFMHNINIIHRSFFPTALPFLFLALPFLALPVSLPCLIPCPAYFLDLPMTTSYAYFLACLAFPFPCLTFPCPACFLALPTSVPCLFPCPAFFLALITSVPYL